jgi:protein phosphatase
MEKYLELDYASLLDRGRTRGNNEDFTAFHVPDSKAARLKSGSQFIVADGVGGAAKGEMASEHAAEWVRHQYYQNPDLPPKERLVQAFKEANRRIYEYARSSGEFVQMATTMVAAVVIQNKLIVANVGDSRAYLIRGDSIRQISQDHSYVAEMVRSGSMTEEEASTSKLKNRISRSIGGEPEVRVDVFPPIPLRTGDKVLLCSDGLTRYANEAALMQMAAGGKPGEIARRMVKFANQSGGVDNISVVFLETVAKSSMKKRKVPARGKPPVLPTWTSASTPVRRTPKKMEIPLVPSLIVISVFIILAFIAISVISGGNFRFWIAAPTIDPTLLLEKANAGAASETTPIPTITPLPTPTVNPRGVFDHPEDFEWNCLYNFKTGDTHAEDSINKFAKFDTNKEYLGFRECSVDGQFVINCKIKVVYPNDYLGREAYHYERDWWIVVREHPIKGYLPQDCIDAGGVIQVVRRISGGDNNTDVIPQPPSDGQTICMETVNSDEVRVWSGPKSEGAPKFCCINKNTEVGVIEFNSKYTYIRVQLEDGTLGWVASKYIDHDQSVCPLPAN